MATITTAVCLEDAARTAGEAMTINSGGSLTIRTDSRVHANAPTSMLGSLGAVTINEGSYVWTSATTRWMAFNSGSGNVPAIGTSVTQGGVSGYLLGVWAAVNLGPTAVGAAMPSTGFLKFREVTGGAYAAGALMGIGASATSTDVQGWIEIAHDTASNITVPRLGDHTVRGGRFYIGVTDGTVGQQFQTPTNGSTVQLAPGAWVETEPDSGVYDPWPGLAGYANKWDHKFIGNALGNTDFRQMFLKSVSGGILQMGEAHEQAATYTSLAVQSSTYTAQTDSGTYTWENDVLTVYCSGFHYLRDGMQTGLNFTSGGAVGQDGIFTITFLSIYHFSVSLVGSGAAGNVSSRSRITVSFTAHGVGPTEQVYLDFTSGGGVDGSYTCFSGTANTYFIAYPSISSVTSGNVNSRHSLTISATAHNLVVGLQVYLDFTSGSGIDGIYDVNTVTTDTFTVIYNHTSDMSGNVTIKRTIGHVAPSGCKVWIPSTILTECATAARNINIVPNTTYASRPEWITTAGGYIDIEYMFASSGYFNFTNPYIIKLSDSIFFDVFLLTNCVQPFEMQRITFGSASADYSYTSIDFLNCYSGGDLSNSKLIRAIGGSETLGFESCYGVNVDDVVSGVIDRIANPTCRNVYISSGSVQIERLVSINGIAFNFASGATVIIKGLQYIGKMNGFTNGVGGGPLANLNLATDITIDDITLGFPNTQPYTGGGMFTLASTKGVGISNVDIPESVYKANEYGASYILTSNGNDMDLSFKRCNLGSFTMGLNYGLAAVSNLVFENCSVTPYTNNNVVVRTSINAKNNIIKGCLFGGYNGTNKTSTYGSHFNDYFIGPSYGVFGLDFCEPTVETSPQFTVISGEALFDGGGLCYLKNVGTRAEWEDSCFRLGYTGFENKVPSMMGGTIGHYTLEYKIDTGSGYSAWKTMSGANLSAETIDPAIGFKMKWAVETTTVNTNAIEYLSISMLTTIAAQANLYPLDEITLTIPGLITGSDVVIYNSSTGTILDSVDAYSGTSWNYIYETPTTVDIGIFKSGYVPKYIRNYTLLSTDATLPNVAQTPDRNYI